MKSSNILYQIHIMWYESQMINETLDSLKKAKDSGNVRDMKKALEELNNAWSQIAPKLYQSSEQSPPDASDTPEAPKKGKGKDEIEDADFEVVEED